jgi:hypothetical protein
MAKNRISASRLADFRWRRAQVRFTEYDHMLEPVPSQNLAAGETSGFPAHLLRKSKDSSTDEVLGRRRRPFGLSATREDRNPARAQHWL